jgi:peptide subunit release factor 1 (eRF1)
MNLKQKLKFRKFIKELEAIRGRHTELVSVYVPKDYELIKIIQHLQQEQGTASNIKDARTRNNVIDSLERMIRHLRLYKKTPENGLAVFAGNASTSDNKIDIKVWSIEPPEPLKIRLYRCDQTFLLDPLKDMLEYKETYGLIVLDRREGDIGLLKGTNVKVVTRLTSAVPGKSRAGGQCLIPETEVNLPDNKIILLKNIKIGDDVLSYDFKTKTFIASRVFDRWNVVKEKIYKIKTDESIIVSSEDHLFFLENGITKAAEELKVGDMLLNKDGEGQEIKKIEVNENSKINLVDISVKNENFIANGLVVHNSAQRFARLREGAAKEFYKRIAEAAQKTFLDMKNLKGIIIGGPSPTKEEFFNGNYFNEQLKRKVIGMKDLSYTGKFGMDELVNKSRDLLVKEEIMEEKEVMGRFFELLAKEPEKVVYGVKEVEKALDIGAVEILLLSENLDDEDIERYEEKARTFGAEVRIISVDTMEGVQLKDLGKIAGILRYALE